MGSSSWSGKKTLLVLTGAAAVLGIVGFCCMGGVALWLGASFRDSELRAQREFSEDRARQRALDAEQRERERRATAATVRTEPPATLNLAPTATSDRRSRRIEATVTEAGGSIGVSVGDHCAFDVDVLDRAGPPGHVCRAFAQCAGVRLFGEDLPRRTGFFPCELYDAPVGVAGEDLEPTVDAASGDPIFQIDTRTQRLVVIDNERGRLGSAFRVAARIDSVTTR